MALCSTFGNFQDKKQKSPPCRAQGRAVILRRFQGDKLRDAQQLHEERLKNGWYEQEMRSSDVAAPGVAERGDGQVPGGPVAAEPAEAAHLAHERTLARVRRAAAPLRAQAGTVHAADWAQAGDAGCSASRLLSAWMVRLASSWH